MAPESPPENSIPSRVDRTFSSNQRYAEEFLSTVRENWRESLAATGRTAILIIALMLVFELLTRSSIEKISIAGFEINDLSLIQRAIPLIIAYYFYDLINLILLQGDHRAAHGELIRILHRDIWDTELDMLLWPRTPSLLRTSRLGRRETKLDTLFQSALTVAVVFAGIMFEAYAFYIQFRIFGFKDVLVWITVILSIAFTAYGLIRLATDKNYKPIRTGLHQEKTGP
jgi:hypothetical protein